MAQVGAANGSLLPLASLLAGWVKVPGDIPRDFVTSPSLLCQALCRMEATSQGSHTPQLPALSGPKRPLVVGEVGAWSVQRVTKGQQALSTAVTPSWQPLVQMPSRGPQSPESRHFSR